MNLRRRYEHNNLKEKGVKVFHAMMNNYLAWSESADERDTEVLQKALVPNGFKGTESDTVKLRSSVSNCPIEFSVEPDDELQHQCVVSRNKKLCSTTARDASLSSRA